MNSSNSHDHANPGPQSKPLSCPVLIACKAAQAGCYANGNVDVDFIHELGVLDIDLAIALNLILNDRLHCVSNASINALTLQGM